MTERKASGATGGEDGPVASGAIPDGMVAGPGAAASAKPLKPRRATKGAAKAMAKAEALSAAGAAAMAELGGLQRQIGQLVQGLTAMQDAQGTQTEMLLALLKAMAAPTGPENTVAEALQVISAQLAHANLQAGEIRSVLARLPGEVASAVGREMAAALDPVR